MNDLRVVLLDLDGTLVDAHDAIVEGVIELAVEAGLGSPDPAFLRSCIGQPPELTWAQIGASDPAAMVLRFTEVILPRLPERTRLIDGVADGLSRLTAMGLTLAVATTRLTDSALRSLEVTGLAGFVSHVSGRDQVARSKPEPDVLLHALEAVGAAPDQALMIGDTNADVGAAHAAGMPCWGVLTGVGDEDSLRDAGVDHILEGGLAAAPSAIAAGHPTRRTRTT